MKQKQRDLLVRAHGLIEANNYQKAALLINEVLDDIPDCEQALYMLGFIAYQESRFGMARCLLRRAIDLGSPNAKVITLYGRTFQEGHELGPAEDAFRRAMSLDPSYVDPYVNLGLNYIMQAQPRKALPLLEKALVLAPDLPEAMYNRGIANLLLKRWDIAWPDYEQCLGRVSDRKERIYRLPDHEPRWDGTKGKTVVTYGEQGIGDEISFASCIPDLIRDSEKVIVDCDRRLEGLFKRSFPEADVYGTRFAEAEWPQNYKIDARAAMSSLPGFYRTDESQFPGTPYLKADPERRLQWRSLFDSINDKPWIGIAWTGGSKITGSHRRSLKLEQLLPLLTQIDANFVSLEYKDRKDEIEAFENKHGIRIHNWPRATMAHDYDDVAGLVAELDMVVGVTTASLRLAGALGVKTVAMVQEWPIWFWGIEGSTIPWSKCTTIHRQRGSWDSLIKRVAYDVESMFRKTPVKAIA